MKLNISNYFVCLLFCTISIQAFSQDLPHIHSLDIDTLVLSKNPSDTTTFILPNQEPSVPVFSQSYSFDKDSLSAYQSFNDVAIFTHLKQGVRNEALLLNAHEKQYLKLPYEPSSQAFSVSFWFQIADNQSYPLVYQTQSDKKNNVQKFIEFGINEHKVYLKDKNKDYLINFNENSYDSEQWHLLNYVFDGEKTINCFVDGQLVGTNELALLCQERPNRSNAIFIARGHKMRDKLDNNYLHGAIDELQIIEKSLDSLEIQEMYQTHIAQTKRKNTFPITAPIKTNQPDIVFVQPKPKTTKAERKSKVQKTIQVDSHLLKIELWDFDEYDEDKISIYLNDDTLPYQNIENVLLPKERKKINRDIILTPNKINTLTFFATDLGKWYVQNTIGLVVYEINEKGKKKMINKKDESGTVIPYKLICTGQENAVLAIEQRQKESYCKTIDLGQTKEKSVVLQISSKHEQLLKYLNIEDSLATNFTISKVETNKKSLSYTLQLTDNNLHIIPIAIKPIDIDVSNAEFYIKLKKNNLGKMAGNQAIKLKEEYIYKPNRPFAFESNTQLNLQLRHEQEVPPNVAATIAIDKTVSLKKYEHITDFELRIQDVLRKKGTKLVIMFDDEIITDTISLKRKQIITLPKIEATKHESYIKIIPISIGKQMTVNAKVVTKDNGDFIEDFKLTIKETKKPTVLAIKR